MLVVSGGGGGEVELLGTGETPGAGDDIPGDVSGECTVLVSLVHKHYSILIFCYCYLSAISEI